MALCFNQRMRFYRLFVTLMLALFCVGTVHAASMGITMQLSSAQGTAMAHCHDMDGSADHGDSHAKPHHGNFCQSCSACCASMLVGQSYLPLVLATAPAHDPHREASYLSFVGKLLHRPPISA